MTEKEEGHAAGDGQADDVKGNFDLRVGNAGDLGQLPGKEIRGNDGQAAPVGQGDAQTDEQIAGDKIDHQKRQTLGQHVDPQLMDIQQFAEDEAHNKAEKIGRNEFFPKDHETEDEKPLKNIRPGA